MQDELADEYHDEEEEMEKLAFIDNPEQQQHHLLQHEDWRQHTNTASNHVRLPQQQQQSEKARIPMLTHFFYTEDLRISRILRRLCTETSPVLAAEICEKLEVAVRSPSNAAYICRSLEMLLDNVVQILKQCPLECVNRVSNILGIIGYISRSNFPIYKNFISKNYQSSKCLQKYLMLALKSTFRCDAMNLDLIVYSERTLELLIDYLENAEKAETFIAVSETIVEFSKNYKHAFSEHFTDVVDIVVGWHLETDQPQSLKLHCSLVLQKWAAYFLNELDFTYGLLGQFLEDINAWYEDLTAEGATKKAKYKAEIRIAAFIGAFTSILKSLSTPTEFVVITTELAFMENSVTSITKAAKEAFTSTFVGEEIVYNVNDFLSSLLAHNYAFNEITEVEELIRLEIEHLGTFNVQQIETLLYTILCLVRHKRTAMSCSMISLIFGINNNTLAVLKLTQDQLVYKLLLKIYHEILMLKNVPLLQEAYKHIKCDIYDAVQMLSRASEKNKYNFGEFSSAMQKLHFYFSALAVLATQTSSIISMYALDPSILELLIQNCKAVDASLWTVEPTLYNALLQLLAVHCQKSRNFITTSHLLNDEPYVSQVLEEQSRNSPTSEHFTHILQFFASILENSRIIGSENMRLLLNWLQQLFHECVEYMPILLNNKIFLHICKNLCTTSAFAPIESANCIRVLLKAEIPPDMQTRFKDISIYHLNSVNDNVVKSYADILSLLPLMIAFLPTNLLEESAEQLNQMYELQKWYRSTCNFSPLRLRYFKEFLDYMNLNSSENKDTNDCEEHSVAKNDSFLLEILSKCFINQTEHEKATDYQNIARKQRNLVIFWIQLEAARYCVRNKLRTTVGKPQETFLAIEAIIMKYARMLTSKEIKDKRNVQPINLDRALELQRKARILLGFLECLEKNIYNAAQGTAFALPATEKPAKSFFRINASTCNEWFKRIRPAVCLIATHCMEPELVIRYSEQSLTKKDQMSTALMEHTLINFATALLQRHEGDTLQGVYIWLRNSLGKDFTWLQYAAEQANGQMEQAAKGYRSLLDENHMRMDGLMKQFIMEQLMYCLYYTGQWRDVQQILAQHTEKDDNFASIMNTYSAAHLETMENLCYGTENKFLNSSADNLGNVCVSDALLQLMNWSTCEQNRENSTTLPNFSIQQTLRKIENICIVQTFKSNDTNDLSSDMVHAIQAGLREGFGRGCILDERKIEQCEEYIFINHILAKIQSKENFQTAMQFVNGSHHESTILMKCLLWTLLLEQRAHASGNYLNDFENVSFKHSLYLDMAANAREDGNNNCCRSMLKRFFELKGFNNTLEEFSACLRNNELELNITDDNLLRGTSELAKCLFNANGSTTQIQQNQYDAINISSSLCLQIVNQVKRKEDGEDISYPAIAAKTLLNLSDWLGQRNIVGGNSNNAHINLNNLPQLQELLKNLPETSVQLTDDKLNISMPAIDKAIGRLINASISQRNDAGNTWLAYGNWCYRWGKKLVELKNSENQALSTQITDQYLSERDLKDIKNTLKQDISNEVLHQIANLLQRHQLGSKNDVVDDEIEANDISSVESIEQELRKLDSLTDISEDEVKSIIRIWRRTHKTVYAYYETAIRAYLKYLSIETSDTNNCNNSNSIVRENNVEDSGFVTTTLRLLRLVVKHAFALQDVLEEGLNSTPLRPWRVIIPQLFSRLNHHEPYVRNSLAQLLCRLAQQEPHAVIFPAVVGSQEEGTNCTIISTAKKTLQSVPTTNTLTNCFSSLVSSLAKQAPETVRHVQMLVKELRRVALLWDEYWIHALGRLLTEYSSLFSGLVIETRKSNGTNEQQVAKLKAKHELLLQYVITDLKKIVSTTDKSTETKYEQNFKEHYQQYINQTVQQLTQPEMIVAGPIESWQKLKNLYQRFQQRSMHPSGAAASTLKIDDLSSILSKMHDTAISMPGIERSRGEAVYIQSIESGVHILPTKTRPKKLVFLGSDGRKYTYLLKGLEDLHLDERIMQFLSISNLMMERTRDRRRQTQTFRAHYYSVIPLGPQSGLISWVDGVTPLFAIYKKWQQRDAASKQQLNKERPNMEHQQVSLAQPPISASSQFIALRPSELFYKKLRPLLAAQNIKLRDPRKQWPLEILRRVLDELTEETPHDLLSKELWCHATSAAEWRKTVRNYTVSMAVMSVIGYIVGLGDRHLDNILINLVTGEIVHIDYNVCFEKGKTFRVPEKVPFRLTRNFENALGSTGVEGSYRLCCEYVLRTLRKEKETLLTLLEAFVYDPLVDWTVNDSGVGVDDDEEWEQVQQNIKTKFEDMKNVWSEYMYDVEKQVSKIDGTAQELNIKLKSLHNAEEELNLLNQQVAKIRELEMLGTAIGSHSLNTITQRFQAYKNDREAIQSLHNNAKVAHNDIETLFTIFFDHILGYNGDLMKMKTTLSQHETTFVDEFETERVYIRQISEKLYQEANFARKEMDNSLQQELRAARECIKYMNQYASIMEFYPRTRLRERNCLFQYADLYRQLLDDEIDLRKLQTEVDQRRTSKRKNKIKIDYDKAKIIKYVSAMEKITYELNMDLHQIVMSELNLQQQQIPTVDSVIAEIKDFASLDINTCSTLQGAMLLVLTETLIQLDQNEKSPNLFKEIDFIDSLEFVFEQLQLIPRSLQQQSEQKLLKSLRNILLALHDFEHDMICEKVVRLFFLDDNEDLQEYVLKLCRGDINIHLPDPEKDDALRQLHSLLLLLQYHFDKVEMQLQQLKNVIKEILDIQACSWYNILLERLSIIKNLSDDGLTAWKKETVSHLFSTARDQVNSLKANNVEMVYDVYQLTEPIIHYVKTIHGKYLHGVTIALTEAYISSFQTRVEYLDGNAAARLLCNKLVKAIQHNFELEELHLRKQQKTQNLDHYNRVASSYLWFNRSSIDEPNNVPAHIIVKDKLLSVIENAKQSMGAWKQTIIQIQNEISQHTEIVRQRLRWAVAGVADSDKAINDVMSRFEENSEAQTERYNFFLKLAINLTEYASALLRFESLMDDSAAGLSAENKMEQSFCELLDDWQKVRARYAQSSSLITTVEESIVQLLDPEDKIDACWIANITGLLDELIFAVQRNLGNLEEERKAIQDRLYLHSKELQNIIDNPIRTDMRQFLRTIVKNAKYSIKNVEAPLNNADEASLSNLTRSAWQTLKILSGKLGDLKMKLCLRDDYSQELLTQLNEKIKDVQNTIEQHWKELNDLAQHYLEHNPTRSKCASPAHLGSLVANKKKNMEKVNIGKDEIAVLDKKGEQKRNAYAVSVWKRIRMKLEGRDPDLNRRSNVAEQVDFIIAEATNRDNLAVLYEGWTPWV